MTDRALELAQKVTDAYEQTTMGGPIWHNMTERDRAFSDPNRLNGCKHMTVGPLLKRIVEAIEQGAVEVGAVESKKDTLIDDCRMTILRLSYGSITPEEARGFVQRKLGPANPLMKLPDTR